MTHFFKSCHDAGPDKCTFWFNSPEDIRDQFFKADRRLLEQPLPVPGFGLLKAPLWRSGVYNALYQPAEVFPLLAGVTAEIRNRTAGPAIQLYLDIVKNASLTVETLLIEPRTGLKNSPNAGLTIACSEGGAQVEDLDTRELEAVFGRYSGVSRFFAGVSSQYYFVCLGK